MEASVSASSLVLDLSTHHSQLPTSDSDVHDESQPTQSEKANGEHEVNVQMKTEEHQSQQDSPPSPSSPVDLSVSATLPSPTEPISGSAPSLHNHSPTSLPYTALLPALINAQALLLASQEHLSSKKYRCPNCLAAFTTKETLSVHVRSYCRARAVKGTSDLSVTENQAENETAQGPTQTKRFKCEMCGVCFSQAATLKTHRHMYCTGGTLKSVISPLNVMNLLSQKHVNGGTVSPDEGSRNKTGNQLRSLASDIATSPHGTDQNSLQKALVTRKRRSPNLETEHDLKPFAKFQCRNCLVKFYQEDTLKQHEKSYCSARNSKKTRLETVSNGQSPAFDGVSVSVSKSESPSLPENEEEGIVTSPQNTDRLSPTVSVCDFICRLCNEVLSSAALLRHLSSHHRILPTSPIFAHILTLSCERREANNQTSPHRSGGNSNELQPEIYFS